MKKYFLLNDRNDVSKGYAEVSEAEIRKYVSEFSDGKRYFINLGYAVMETNRENYYAFYKEKRRQKYIREEAELFGEVSYNALDSDEFRGADVVIDKSEPFEDVIEGAILTERLPGLLSLLNDEEREIIIHIFYKKESERELAKKWNIPRKTLSYRKEKVLKNLKKLFAN